VLYLSASKSVQEFGKLTKSHHTDPLSPKSLNAFADNRRILVLPHSDDNPVRLLKDGLVSAITGNVRIELAAPPISIRLRSHRMLWATMPKTAVGEHCDLGSGENNVWPPWKIRNIDPVSKPTSVQFPSQRQLRFRPSCAEIRHESTHRRARRLRFSRSIRLGSHG
jgi:hypothetical protein